MKIIGYVRVSTSEQAEGGVSLDQQRARIEGYCSLYEHELVEVIVDAGASARTLARDGLQRALGLLRAGAADGICVAKLDRLTRSVADLGHLLSEYFGSGPYQLLSVTEQLDTSSASGRLVLNVMGALAQWERETISERVTAAMQHLREIGRHTGGEAPYGFQLSACGRYLEPNLAEREVMEAAAELRAQGLSLRKVGAALEERGHLPRTAARWHPSTVSALLADCA